MGLKRTATATITNMGKRKIIIVAVLVIFGVVVMLWLRSPSHNIALGVRRGSLLYRRRPQARPNLPVAATAGQTASAPQPEVKKPSPQEQRRETITAWEQAREKEVEFWGKVIDQHNEPVTGVAVTATITTHQVPPPGFKPQPDDHLLGKYGHQWRLLYQRATWARVHH